MADGRKYSDISEQHRLGLLFGFIISNCISRWWGGGGGGLRKNRPEKIHFSGGGGGGV